MTDKPMLILIAGPYRSGTDGDRTPWPPTSIPSLTQQGHA